MSVIQLIAPSGYCINQAAAARGIERLQQEGHRITNAPILARRFQRFAGSDEQRLEEINALAQTGEEVDIILAVRGGYGVSRLLPQIDYGQIGRAFRQRTPVMCGHSDFTGLQLALLAQCGIITFSGPMLAANFGAEIEDPFTREHFWRAVREPHYSLSWPSAAAALKTSGTLWGGNLTLLCSLIGTPWLPNIQGGILVLEDINEHPFRVERMLLQLHQAGILARQHAIILGSFSGATREDYDAGFSFASVRQNLQQMLQVPILEGLPFGHEPQTVTLALGAFAELVQKGDQASLSVSGHPILRR